MMRFIYTQHEQTRKALEDLGFESLGYVSSVQPTRMYVFKESETLKLPDEFKNTCWVSNTVFFVTPEGGDNDEQRR